MRVAQVVDAAHLSRDVASIYFRIKSIKGNESSLSLQTTCLVGNHLQIIKCILEHEIVPWCMTFKTDLRKTVEAGSSRNFSYSEESQAAVLCLYSSLDACLHSETVFTVAAGVPYGQGRRTAWEQGRAASPQRCTPLVWLLWRSPHPVSKDNRGRLVGGAESMQEQLAWGSGSQCQKVTNLHLICI